MNSKPFAELTACEILSNLREAQYNAATGKHVQRVRYRSDTGAEREMDYSNLNVAELSAAIIRYENLCEISKGNAGTGRRCFVGGL